MASFEPVRSHGIENMQMAGQGSCHHALRPLKRAGGQGGGLIVISRCVTGVFHTSAHYLLRDQQRPVCLLVSLSVRLHRHRHHVLAQN